MQDGRVCFVDVVKGRPAEQVAIGAGVNVLVRPVGGREWEPHTMRKPIRGDNLLKHADSINVVVEHKGFYVLGRRAR